MATAFELLEAYVTIGERGSNFVIAQLARVEAATIAATQRPIRILITTNAQQALQGLGTVAPQLAQVQRQIGQMQQQLAGVSAAATQAQAAMARMAASATTTSGALTRAQGSAAGFSTSVLGMARGLATFAGIASAAQLVSESFQEAFGQERSFVTFEAVLKDGAKARDLLQEIAEVSQRLPFPIGQLRQTAQQLLALGSSAENIVNELVMIADVSAGAGASIERVARVYTQVRSKQQLYAEELQQFGDAGIPILQELASNLQLTTVEVRKLAEQGKIGFPEVERAFRTLTAEGGKFANLTERISQTLPGAFQRLRNEMAGLGSEFAGLTVSPLVDTLEVAILSLQSMRELIGNIRGEAEGLSGVPFLSAVPGGAILDLAAQEARFRREMDRIARESDERNQQALQFQETKIGEERFRALRAAVEAAAQAVREFPILNLGAELADEGLFSQFQEMTTRAQSFFESLADPDRDVAASLRESLLTPLEEFQTKIDELRMLFSKGFISEDFLGRGIQAALNDMDRLLDKQSQLRRSFQDTSFDIGTREGLTVVLRESEEQKRSAAVQTRQMRLQEAANGILVGILQGVQKLQAADPQPQQLAQETDLF